MSSASRVICVSGWRCPSGGRFSRKGHVEALGGDEPVGALEERAALLHGRLDPLADGVQGHSGLAVPDLAEG